MVQRFLAATDPRETLWRLSPCTGKLGSAPGAGAGGLGRRRCWGQEMAAGTVCVAEAEDSVGLGSDPGEGGGKALQQAGLRPCPILSPEVSE